MKIITDPLNQPPSHSVSRRDVETVLRNVPPEWVGDGLVFAITAQKFESSRWTRPVIRNTDVFKIMSRGLSKQIVIWELLVELAKRPVLGGDILKAHKISGTQRKRIEEIIRPIFEAVMAEIQ